MKYLINQTVCFDFSNGALNLISDEAVSVQLSRPGVRLLHALITQNGVTLTRGELLKNVWEDHGLIPSNSNLSNHISFLRKVFSQLGMEENIIITEPREGFRFQAEVETVNDCRYDDEYIQKSVTSMNNVDTSSPPTFNWLNKERLRNISHLFIKTGTLGKTFTILIILSLLTLVIINTPVLPLIFHKKQSTSFSIGHCQIIDLDRDENKKIQEKIGIIKKAVNDKNINCVNQKSSIYFKIIDLSLNTEHNQQAVFLTQCFPRASAKEAQCDNYFLIGLKKP